MVIIIQNKSIWFPTYVSNVFQQGTKISAEMHYDNFVFIALREVGITPKLHYHYKTTRDLLASTEMGNHGVYLDFLGGIYSLHMTTLIDGEFHENIVSRPRLYPISRSPEDNEYNVVGLNSYIHESAMAFLLLGLTPEEAIRKTAYIHGHPEVHDITCLDMDKIIKRLNNTHKTKEKDGFYDDIKRGRK